MATMSEADLVLVWETWMRENKVTVAVVDKNDLREAVDAADQWVSDNQVSYNLALPVTARSNLTQAQKARLLWFVVQRRFMTDTA